MLSEYLAFEYRRVSVVISRIGAQTQLNHQFPLRKMIRALTKIFLFNYF